MLFPRSVTLLGPTASGKTDVALAVARQFSDVEIVSVDSMTIYTEMTVGTAKPSKGELGGVKYHLLDVASVQVEYSLADFLRDCVEVDGQISSRSSRVLLVGGTALYLKAVLDSLSPPGRFPGLRDWLIQRSFTDQGITALYGLLSRTDPSSAALIEMNNVRRIVRSLEVGFGSGIPFSSHGPGLDATVAFPRHIVGIDLGREVLKNRIRERVERQFDQGWIEEARHLARMVPPVSRTAAQALGYKELGMYIRGEMSLEEARQSIVSRTYKFSKRQMAWFKRDSRVVWTHSTEEATEVVVGLLSDL